MAERIWQPEIRLKRIHPLVVVLLGGTGRKIGEALKHRLRRSFGEGFNRVKILSFDVTDEREEMAEAAELSGGEFYLLEPGDIRFILEHLEEEPYIHRWFPDPAEYPIVWEYQTLEDGAGTQRLLARLVPFLIGDQILREVANALDEVRAATLEGQAVEPDIVMAGSLGGATFSGQALDIGALLRASDAVTFRHLDLIGVLAGPYSRYASYPLIKANCYQMLREIDAFHDGTPFEVSYSDLTQVKLHRIWDRIFLIDKEGHGSSLRDEKDAARMIARYLFHWAVHNGRDRFEQALANRKGIFAKRFRGHRCGYCSFGLARLTFPREALTELAKLMEVRKALRTVLDPDPAVELALSSHGLLEKYGLRAQEVLHSLYDLEDVPERLVGDVLKASNPLGRLKEWADYSYDRLREPLEAKVREHQEAFKAHLRSEVTAWLPDTARGLAYTERTLDLLEEALNDELRSLDEDLQSQLDAQQKRVVQGLTDLEGDLKSFLHRLTFRLFPKRWKERITEIVEAINARDRLAIRLLRQEKARSLLKGAIDVVAELRRAYPAALRDRLTRALEHLEAQIEAKQETIEPSSGVDNRILTAEENIRSFIEASFGETDLATKVTQGAPDWLKLPLEEPARLIAQLLKQLPPPRTVAFHFLEDLEETVRNELLVREYHRAHPYLDFRRNLGDELVEILCGYSREELDLVALLPTGAAQVEQRPILGKNELVIIRTRVGIPASVIGKLREYAQAYLRISKENPVELMPETRGFRHLYPQGEEERTDAKVEVVEEGQDGRNIRGIIEIPG